MNIGLIFDMDGVIIDNHQYHFNAWKIICEKYGKPLNEDSYRENLNGRTLDQVVKFIFDEPMPEDKVHEIGHEKEALYRQLYQPYIEPVPGLLKILGDASQENIPMVIGTSSPKENVAYTMKGTGIRHYFRGILDDRAVEKGRGKPNPDIYQKCAKHIHLPNQQCVVFEDAPSGITAGKAAGSKVIGVATSYSREVLDGDLIINDFGDITLEQIKALLRK